MNNQNVNTNINPNINPNVNPVKKRSNNGISGGIIILITLLIIGLVGSIGYIVYNKVYVKDNNVISTQEMLKYTKVDAEGLLQMEDTINTFERAFHYWNSKYFGYLYNQEEIEVSEFDNGAALFASIYHKYENAPVPSYVSNIEVKETFKSMFGSSLKYSSSNIIVNNNHTIIYNDSIKYYSSTYPGDGGYFHPTYFSNIESIAVSENEVIVVKNVGYIEYTNNNTAFTIYKDSSKKKLVKTLTLKDGSFIPNELVARYKSKLSEYTYTFKINGDNYTFQSIKRTR